MIQSFETIQGKTMIWGHIKVALDLEAKTNALLTELGDENVARQNLDDLL